MALKKLPCEYKELSRERWKVCFGEMTEETQIKLLEAINKIMEVCNIDDSRKFKSINIHNQ